MTFNECFNPWLNTKWSLTSLCWHSIEYFTHLLTFNEWCIPCLDNQWVFTAYLDDQWVFTQNFDNLLVFTPILTINEYSLNFLTINEYLLHNFTNKSIYSFLDNQWVFTPILTIKGIRIKGIHLSKALTCMKIFLYKQELLFCQGDGYLWSHCCMNNLYISHRSLNALTYSFWAIGSMLISLFRVTSWFDTVNNAVIRWMNFNEHNLHEHDLQLFNYNI